MKVDSVEYVPWHSMSMRGGRGQAYFEDVQQIHSLEHITGTCFRERFNFYSGIPLVIVVQELALRQ